MKSLIYIDRRGLMSFGQRALDLCLEQNTGRAARYEMRRVGQVEMVYSGVGTLVQDAFALIDVNEPGRLFQSLKRFLPAKVFRATNVYGLDFNLEELLSLLAQEIVVLTEEALGERVTNLTVGWPVRFSEDPEAEALARDRLPTAWQLATNVEVRFFEEPVAALAHFSHEIEMQKQEHALVFDFGGGTLDVCVAKVGGVVSEPLATAGLALGGDLLDSRIVETRLTGQFGEHAVYRKSGLPLPRRLFTRLKGWQTMTELNKPESLEIIRWAKRELNEPEKLAALEALVSKNYGMAFFQAVEQAKVALSSEMELEVRLVTEEISLREKIGRPEFEGSIRSQIQQGRECVQSAVSAAGLTPADIQLCVTTGGSSLIPAFRNMLRDTLPHARIIESDAFTSVAAGLAILGA